MKIICSKEALSKGVNIVSKAVPTRTTMSILECILIDASSGEIKLTANDMEIGIETIIEGTIEERGIVALDAKFFSDVVRKLPDNFVTIETDSTFNTVISCERVNLSVTGRSGADFSYIPIIQRNEPIVISQLTFKDIVRQTIFSTATNENNKILTGELFEIKNNILKLVALDGHRVAIRNVPLAQPTNDTKVIIPAKTLNEITKILDGGIDDIINIYVTSNHIVFEFENTTVVSRLIEGDFFNVDQMLSVRSETTVTISKRDLINSIDRASLYVKEGDKKPIICDFRENEVSIAIKSFIGSMNEQININKTGNDITIGFNHKFLNDALRVIDEETINLYMLNAKTPCFIKDEAGTYTYIVLPINFNNAGAN